MIEDPASSDGARLWAAAQALARAADSVRGRAGSRVPPLLLFTDPQRTPAPWTIVERMPRGSGVIYRPFGAPDARDVAGRLRALTRERSMTLLIGLDAELADRVGADGVHLPERALSAAYGLSGRRPAWILTGAAHSAAAALAARDLDAVVLSPIFTAGGASAARPPLGLAGLSSAARGVTRVIALGGVTADTAAGLEGTGCAGLAAVAGVASTFGP